MVKLEDPATRMDTIAPTVLNGTLAPTGVHPEAWSSNRTTLPFGEYEGLITMLGPCAFPERLRVARVAVGADTEQAWQNAHEDFVDSSNKCNGTMYLSSSVQQACSLHAPDSKCAGDSDAEKGLLFCRDQTMTADNLFYPQRSGSYSELMHFVDSHQFGGLVSSVCMDKFTFDTTLSLDTEPFSPPPSLPTQPPPPPLPPSSPPLQPTPGTPPLPPTPSTPPSSPCEPSSPPLLPTPSPLLRRDAEEYKNHTRLLFNDLRDDVNVQKCYLEAYWFDDVPPTFGRPFTASGDASSESADVFSALGVGDVAFNSKALWCYCTSGHQGFRQTINQIIRFVQGTSATIIFPLSVLVLVELCMCFGSRSHRAPPKPSPTAALALTTSSSQLSGSSRNADGRSASIVQLALARRSISQALTDDSL